MKKRPGRPTRDSCASSKEGEFAGAGAYRLGEYLFAEKKYDPALMQFQLAAKEAANDEVRLSANTTSPGVSTG